MMRTPGSDAPVLRAAFVLCALLLFACSADKGANEGYRACKNDDGCGNGEYCYRGYCLAGDGGASGPIDGSTPLADAGKADSGRPPPVDAGEEDAGEEEDAGSEPPAEPCDVENAMDSCYSGPPGTRINGGCRAGLKACSGGFYGPCVNGIVPAAQELCNGEDDDCDGEIDEDDFGSCNTSMMGLCAEGHLVCFQGRAICAVLFPPDEEACDDQDNDCDGTIDEGDIASPSCYPDSTPGCMEVGGAYQCKGVCKAGVQQCVNGQQMACDGFVTPAVMEDCLAVPAVNDDCDDATDEGCVCGDGQTRDCYDGPAGTQLNAPCMTGTQTCSGVAWGTCEGDVLPGVETCANPGVDDDCNNMDDDVPMQGNACVDEDEQGRCHTGTLDCVAGALDCVTPEPRDETCDASDDDCDGEVDEDFNLQEDEDNCGECGESCDMTCCGGNCIDTRSSEQYCGSCTNPCGSGLTCCGGQCFNLQSDNNHCGACSGSGTVCGLGSTCCHGMCRLLSLGC